MLGDDVGDGTSPASPERGQDLEEGPAPVLVVDDRAENRIALRSVLPPPSYRVVEAASGRQALAKLLDEEFAVLLLDVVMPEMSGFELARAIKEREKTAALPIIFLTAHATEMDAVFGAYRAGAVDYLVKPLVPEVVRAKVSVFADLYIQRRRIVRQAARLVEAQRAEGKLRLAELELATDQRYRSLTEAVPIILWTAVPDGTVDYFNHRWFESTGMSVEAAAGSWLSAVHPHDLERCKRDWNASLRSEQPFKTECRLRTPIAGVFRWHLCRALPEPGTAGRVVGWLGTLTDIDDQMRVQEVLAEYKGTLDALLDGVLISDLDGRLLYANQGASSLTGYSREELASAFNLLVLAPDEGVRGRVTSLKDGSASKITFERELRHRDGHVVPVEVSFQLVHIDDGRMLAIVRDVTERRRAQRERELLYREAVDAIHTRDEFLSIASHELRTPLTSLQLQVESLLRPRRGDAAGPSAEQIRPKLENARKHIGRLTWLLAELLDVSKITSGRLHLELQEVDLVSVVREAVGRLSQESANAQTTIEVRAPDEFRGKWDGARLDQVITNLLTNALKFGAGAPITVSVEGDAELARVSVTDRGIGIAPEDTERIFERFEQAGSARSYGGLGLGLYITRRVVEAHGGTIRVTSQPGAGSTFTVTLPRVSPEAIPVQHEREAGSQSGGADHVDAGGLERGSTQWPETRAESASPRGTRRPTWSSST
jgi:PAS domain S-box-containing protein